MRERRLSSRDGSKHLGRATLHTLYYTLFNGNFLCIGGYEGHPEFLDFRGFDLVTAFRLAAGRFLGDFFLDLVRVEGAMALINMCRKYCNPGENVVN